MSNRNLLIAKLQAATAPLRANPFTFTYVTDYEPGDPATAKVRLAMLKAFGSHDYTATTVGNFDTAAGSFDTMALLLQPRQHRPEHYLGYLNVAPIYAGGDRNGHHPFLVALMKNGTVIGSPNAGHSLSFLRPYAEAFYQIRTQQDGVQFRSWAAFPQPFAAVVLRQQYELVEEVWAAEEAELIPGIPAQDVLDADNYGNLRFRHSDRCVAKRGWRAGDTLELRVAGRPPVVARYGELRDGEDPGKVIVVRPGSNVIEPEGDTGPRLTFLDGFVIQASAKSIVCPNDEALSGIHLVNVDAEQRARA